MRSYIKFYSWSMLWIIPLSLVFSLGQFDTSSIIMFVIASLGIPLGLKAVPRLAGQFEPRSVVDIIASLDDISLRSKATGPLLPKLVGKYSRDSEFWVGLSRPQNPRDHVG